MVRVLTVPATSSLSSAVRVFSGLASRLARNDSEDWRALSKTDSREELSARSLEDLMDEE